MVSLKHTFDALFVLPRLYSDASRLTSKNFRCFDLQDVFLMIRRKNMTIFTDAKDDTTVLELKKMIEGKDTYISWEICENITSLFFNVYLSDVWLNDYCFGREGGREREGKKERQKRIIFNIEMNLCRYTESTPCKSTVIQQRQRSNEWQQIFIWLWTIISNCKGTVSCVSRLSLATR